MRSLLSLVFFINFNTTLSLRPTLRAYREKGAHIFWPARGARWLRNLHCKSDLRPGPLGSSAIQRQKQPTASTNRNKPPQLYHHPGKRRGFRLKVPVAITNANNSTLLLKILEHNAVCQTAGFAIGRFS